MRQEKDERDLVLGDNAYGQANPQFDAALTSEPTPWGVYDSRGGPPKLTPANVLRVATSNLVTAGAQSLSLGYSHGCGLYEAGGVKCWGDASHGQLGVAAPREAFQVQAMAGLPPLVDVASSLFYSCGRTADGGVWCWEPMSRRSSGVTNRGLVPARSPESAVLPHSSWQAIERVLGSMAALPGTPSAFHLRTRGS